MGQIYGFMVAGIVFIAAMAGIFAFTYGAGSDPAPADQAAQQVDVNNLAAILLGDAGSGWGAPDSLSRLGLANATGTGLDAAHLALLNNSTLDATSDGLLNYEEARLALGLEGLAGFHLNVIPLDFDESLQDYDFSHVKALYLGDFNNVGTITLDLEDASIANANVELNASMASNTGLERTVIDSLGVDFNNQVHLTTTSPPVVVEVLTSPKVTSPLLTYLGLSVWNGDVLFDNKQYLDGALPDKLANGGYDLLVLGSGIDHSTLTANSVKSSVDSFVRNGGTLMVFGSPGANFNWMQPILEVSATSVSGAVTAPDPDHPALVSPWAANWTNYDTNGLGWTLGTPSNFDNVLVQGGKPVIAISNPGAIGSGMVFLSSIQPRGVAQSLGNEEAEHYMFNLLLYDIGAPDDPSLEFGPEPPEGMPVSSAVRTTTVQEGSLSVTVRVELLAWSTP